MPKSGFTLIELLVVVALLAIVSVTAIVSVVGGRGKAEDSSMKSDLDRLKIAFEDYYNDHNCYPPPTWFDSSSNPTGSELRPYLDKIPFNKKTGHPYVLETDTTGCSWFKLYTTLNNADDPQAVVLRTTSPATGSTKGNYGVSSSNTIVSIYYSPTNSTAPSSTPSPSSLPASHYYCSGVHNCTELGVGQTCTPSYANANCTGSGGCASIGICQ